jgi:hypothetical protein
LLRPARAELQHDPLPERGIADHERAGGKGYERSQDHGDARHDQVGAPGLQARQGAALDGGQCAEALQLTLDGRAL